MSRPVRVDPLDALFGPTSPVVAPRPTTPSPSDAPVRAEGVHSRAGNAMPRTRAALLEGARVAVEHSGTRFTMSEVAVGAGVAKATVYNHFRTRGAILDALVEDEVSRLVSICVGLPAPSALTAVALCIAENRMLRSLAAKEPATLAALARMDSGAEGWRLARQAVEGYLSGAGLRGADLVLRWLASQLFAPGTPTAVAAEVSALIGGLADLPVARTA